jgi:hypothetical protein
MLIDLRGNIKVVGATYLTVVPARGKWLVSRGVANEIAEPWRHGRGMVLRIAPRHALSVGRWWPTSDDLPGYLESETPEWHEPSTEEIKSWAAGVQS